MSTRVYEILEQDDAAHERNNGPVSEKRVHGPHECGKCENEWQGKEHHVPHNVSCADEEHAC